MFEVACILVERVSGVFELQDLNLKCLIKSLPSVISCAWKHLARAYGIHIFLIKGNLFVR